MAITRERQLIYEEIKKLTEAIAKLSLTTALEKASSQNRPITRDEAEKMIEISKTENLEIFNLSEFIRTYHKNGSPTIFGWNENLYKYDPKDINPLHLTILFILTYGKVTDEEIFSNHMDFCDSAEELGYTKIAALLRCRYLEQVAPIHNIVKIFS